MKSSTKLLVFHQKFLSIAYRISSESKVYFNYSEFTIYKSICKHDSKCLLKYESFIRVFIMVSLLGCFSFY